MIRCGGHRPLAAVGFPATFVRLTPRLTPLLLLCPSSFGRPTDASASVATTRAEDGSVHVAAHDDVRVLGVMHGLRFDAGGLRSLSAPRLASLRGALEEVLAIVRRQEELVAARDNTGASL